MFTLSAISTTNTFDPLIMLLFALVLDAVLGGMGPLFKVIPHPITMLGRLIGWFDKKLNRAYRSAMERAVRGTFSVLIIAALAGTFGLAIQWLTLHNDFGWMLELFVMITLLAQRELYSAVARVASGLKTSALPGGQAAVAHIVGRDPAYLDEHGVVRAAIESLAENFSDAIVAPAFWYVLFGLPGMMIYKAVNTLDSMIGYRNEKYAAFGFTAARLDDVLNLVPARLAGIIIACAAIVAPRANPVRAFTTMWRDAAKHKSPNAGWPEAAMAGALGLALAGPRRYARHTQHDPWIGTGTARAQPAHIERALYVFMVACLINALLIAVIAVLQFGYWT